MAERFERLFELPNNLYSAESPVIVSAGALLKDTQTGSIIVQLKFQNVAAFAIKALKVNIAAFDAAGEEIEDVQEYQYLDLKIRSGVAFGSNKAIVIPNPVARSFALRSIRVVLENGTVQDVSIPLSPLPQAKTLQSALRNAEMVKQYRLAINEKAVSVPQTGDVLWQCTCGEWNRSETCTACGANKTTVFSAFDITSLTEKMEKRLKEEKAEQEAKAEQERIAAEEEAKRLAVKAAKNRATMKKAKIATAIILPIVALALLFSLWLYPDVIKPSSEYGAAQELLTNGQYDDAVVAFTALGDYKDSAEMVNESLYQKASSLLNEQKYDDSIILFGSLNGYKDSADRIKESKYQKALHLAETGNIEDAITILKTLNGYAESSSNLEALYYQYAGKLLEQGSYDEAKAVYQSIEPYEDSANMMLECDYRKASTFLGAGNYEEALEIFLQINGYKDAGDQALNSKYQFALAKMETSHYGDAITLLEELGDYKDSSNQLLEAKYQRAKQYASSSSGYESAKLLFEELGDYEDAPKYLQLISETKNLVYQYFDYQYYYLWVRVTVDVENCTLKIRASEIRSNDWGKDKERNYSVDYVQQFEEWKREGNKVLMVFLGSNPSEDRKAYREWSIASDWSSIRSQTMLPTGEILGDPGEYVDNYVRITDEAEVQKALESFQR